MAAFRVSQVQANRLGRASQTDYQKAKKHPYSRFVGVAVSPVSGRPIARPQTRQRAVWAVLDTETGWVREIESKHLQSFSKRQYKALNTKLKKAGKPDFYVFEERGRRRAADEAGHVLTSKHAGRTDEPQYELVQRFDRPATDTWRQVYYHQSERLHEVDPRLMKRTPREIIDDALSVEAEPVGPDLYLTTAPVQVSGDTIRDAVKNIRLPFDYQHLSDNDVDMIIAKGVFNVEGEQLPFEINIKEMSDIVRTLSYKLRENLARHGKKYTKEKILNEFEEEFDELLEDDEELREYLEEKREEVRKQYVGATRRVARALKRELEGYDKRLDERRRATDRVTDARIHLKRVAGRYLHELKQAPPFSIDSLSFELHKRKP